MLRHDQLGQARLLGRLFIVVIVSVDKHHDVCVLFDTATLAKVRQERALVGTRLDGTRQLRQGEDQDLERAGDLADLLHAGFGGVVRAHQLQVVDQDQPEIRLLHLQAPRLRADLHQVDTSGVVDVDRCRGEPIAGILDANPVLVAQVATAHPGRIDARLGRDEALRDLVAGHLEAEDDDRDSCFDAEVPRDAERQRRLAHRGARGENQQVRGLEARGDLVERHEP